MLFCDLAVVGCHVLMLVQGCYPHHLRCAADKLDGRLAVFKVVRAVDAVPLVGNDGNGLFPPLHPGEAVRRHICAVILQNAVNRLIAQFCGLLDFRKLQERRVGVCDCKIVGFLNGKAVRQEFTTAVGSFHEGVCSLKGVGKGNSLRC